MDSEVNKEEDVARAFDLCAQDNLEEFELLVPSKVTVNKRVFLIFNLSIKTFIIF